jgi:hypothetical protein
MVDQIITIIGWTSRTLKNITFYQCPDCNSCQEMLFGNGDGFFECFRCDSKFAVEEFVEVKRKRTVVICAGCGREVQLVSPTFGCAGLGFICSGCSNYVAVMYGNHFVNPSMVLDLCWNSSVCERGGCLSQDGLSFVPCGTTKDFLVLRALQAIVKKEDSRFLFARPKEHRAGLLLNSQKRKYLGFLVWTEEEYAILRQIFIVEGERRKGHAERLLKFWVERYADPLNEKFGIESQMKKH